jgi:hypothetical protein
MIQRWWKQLLIIGGAALWFVLAVINLISRIQRVADIFSKLKEWIPIINSFGFPPITLFWVGGLFIFVGIGSFFLPARAPLNSPELWLEYKFSTLTTKDLVLTNNHGGTAANIQIAPMKSESMICTVDLVPSLRPGEAVLLKTRIRQKKETVVNTENLDSFLTAATKKPVIADISYENGSGERFQAKFEMRYRFPEHEVLTTRKSIKRG